MAIVLQASLGYRIALHQHRSANKKCLIFNLCLGAMPYRLGKRNRSQPFPRWYSFSWRLSYIWVSLCADARKTEVEISGPLFSILNLYPLSKLPRMLHLKVTPHIILLKNHFLLGNMKMWKLRFKIGWLGFQYFWDWLKKATHQIWGQIVIRKFSKGTLICHHFNL